MRNDTFNFTPERRLYEQLRPIYDRAECLFIPNSSHGLAGYVTFDKDAHRLGAAVGKVGLPAYVARTFQDGTPLWLLDANPERAQALQTVGDCFLYFAYLDGTWDARHLPEDLLPPEDPWP
jgi:hypothetical protein